MKKTIALLCFWLLCFSVFSQETSTDKPSYFALSTGSSIPLQNFKSTDIKNAYAGFAKNGTKKTYYGVKTLIKLLGALQDCSEFI